jgi:hypothetical protein
MRNPKMLWTATIVLTLVSAVWQRWTGPTYPARGSARLGDTSISFKLLRTQTIDQDLPVRIDASDPSITGEVRWRRFPTADAFQSLPLTRSGEALEAQLPRQPMAGKLEYQVVLQRGTDTAVLPAKPAVARFKGAVNTALLITHVAFMFASLLLSARSGLGALAGGRSCGFAVMAFWLWVVGGMILGPAVQKQAFDAWWTGVPFGYDLTDNKTLIAVVAWGLAAWRCRATGQGRWAILLAAVVTFVVFAIPHSTWGSELQWNAGGAPTPRS